MTLLQVDPRGLILFDDDTEVAHDGDPTDLKEKKQRVSDRSTDWVSDNKMVCTKLIVITTDQMRRSRFKNQKMTITVCDATIEDTKREKKFGLTINNKLTWKENLYSET